MEVLVFDLLAKYAYFKVPEGTRSNFSFPFPPRTTIIGLIAAIMGETRNKYWLDERYHELQIAVEILNKSSTYGIKMNYWRTKSVSTIGGREIDMKIMIASGSDANDRGYTTQVKFDYLTDVAFRVYISSSSDIFSELTQRIMNNKYYYPPYLGHANLLAEIEYVGVFKLNSIDKGEFSTIIPSSSLQKDAQQLVLGYGGYTVYNGVPMDYKIEILKTDIMDDYISIPNRYETIIVPEVGKKINLTLNNGYEVLMDEPKHISFL